VNKRAIFILIICAIFCFGTSVDYAHEFCKPIYWSITEGDYYKTQVSTYLLNANSIYLNNASSAVNSWESSATRASSEITSYSISNVDLVTPPQNIWDTFGVSDDCLALTFLHDTNGYVFNTFYGSTASTGYIRYAGIFVNPNNDACGLNENAQKSIIVHEIGHVYGLWHCPQSTNSIMKPQIYNGFPTYLQTHDINDMNGKYGLPE
jgi:hypothetical protein